MALHPVQGHEDVRRAVVAAMRGETLPHSLLLHGPAGVGKQRMALWIAQLLLCEQPGDEGPCGACKPCRMAVGLQHPDLHWFFPLPRPDASAERLREKLEEARGAELAARREDPFHLPQWDRAPAYFLGSIQNLQRFAGAKPSMGRRKVFVIGDAEAMVPQESSPEAANAFLKLLEEPPDDTTLLLTATTPGALLPTIRSRVLPVRLLPLPTEEVAAFLVRHRGLDEAEAGELATAARGSIGRALRLAPAAKGAAGPLQRRRDAARALLSAAVADSPVARIAAAHAEAPAGARGELLGTLDALSMWLRDLMAVAAGAPEQAEHAGDVRALAALAEKRRIPPLGVAAALMRVEEARELAEGNVNPQLIVAGLLRGMRADLLGAA